MLASTLFQDINEEDMGQGEILAVTALSVINIIYIYIYIYIYKVLHQVKYISYAIYCEIKTNLQKLDISVLKILF